LSDIDAEHPPVAGAPHVFHEAVDAVVVEAQPVDEGLPLGQPEQAGPGGGGVGGGGGRGGFGGPETRACGGVSEGAIVVQPRAPTYWVGKTDAHNLAVACFRVTSRSANEAELVESLE